MFKRKLSALQYPNSDSLNANDEQQFRKLIAWLEENKIKKYKADKRAISDTNSSNWKSSFEQYKQDVLCPIKPNLIIEELDWFLNFALDIEYLKNKTKYEQHSLAVIKSASIPNVVADNPLDCLDFGGDDFKNGVECIAKMLKISPHPNPLVTLKACSKLICSRLNPESIKNPNDFIIKGTPFPYEDAIKGYDLGDPILSKAAKSLRLLYIQNLRDLQTQCNERIVFVQNMTANPKTDTKLGKVGK